MRTPGKMDIGVGNPAGTALYLMQHWSIDAFFNRTIMHGSGIRAGG
jgi:hypothetical protein